MKDYALKINGHNYDVRIDDVNESSTLAHVVVNGTAYEVEIAGAKGAATKRPQVAPAPREADSAKITPATAAPAPRIAPVAPSTGYTIKCPLPGTVLSINVKVGDTIATGQTLVILEAMKMENNIDSDREGNALSLMDVISVEDDMLENLDARDSCAKVRRCVEHCLTEREAKVISLRYGLDGEGPRTQREIASSCGISRSYVSRLEKKALGKLREAMEKG